MSADQESRGTANSPPGQEGPEDPGYIHQAVEAKARWSQRALSPWVQRWLGASTGPAAGRPARPDRHIGTALNAANIHLLLNRVQRTADRGTVWHPDVGSLEPALVDRFAGAIVERFPAVGTKYEVRSLEAGATSPSDLVLAGVDEGPPSEPAQPARSRPLPSFAEVQRGIEAARARSSQLPSTPPRVQQEAAPRHPAGPIPSQVQREAAEPQRRRVFSRVEEITPDGRTPEAAPGPTEPVPDQIQDEALAVSEERGPPGFEVEPPTVRDRPEPSRPTELPLVQRQIDQDVPVQPMRTAEEAPPPAPEPPRPSMERDLPSRPAETPPVQREAEEEIHAPGVPTPLLGEEAAPSEPETPVPPLAEVEPPHPPVEREVMTRPVKAPLVEREMEEDVPIAVPTPTKEALPPEPEPPVPPPAEVEPPQPLMERELPPRQVKAPPALPETEEEEIPAPHIPTPALEEEAPLPEPEPAAPPLAEEEPPRPPVERELPPRPVEAPPVLRQVEEEIPTRAPTLGEEAPSLEPELPKPPSAELEPPQPLMERELPPRQVEAPPIIPEAEEEEEIPAARTPTPVLGEEAPLPEPEPASPPLAEGELPPRQVEAPPVLRQVEEEIPTRAPTLGEEPPSLEPELPKPPSAELEPPQPLMERELPPRQVETPPVVLREAKEEEEIRAPRVPTPPLEEEVPLPEPEPAAPPLAKEEPSRLPAEGELPPGQVEAPPVLRQVAEEVRAPHVPTPSPAEEAPPPKPEPPAPPAAEVTPPHPPVGREVTAPKPLPVQREVRVDEAAVALDETILARAASRAHMPLSEPLLDSGFETEQDHTESPEALVKSEMLPAPQADVIQTKPLDRTAILPQARIRARREDEEATGVVRPADQRPVLLRPQPYTPPGPLSTPRVVVMPRREPVAVSETGDTFTRRAGPMEDELPLPPVVQPASADMVQRQPVDAVAEPVAPSEGLGIVQRVVEIPPETGPTSEAEGPAPNLDHLARQVFPLIKRMLAVERERRPGR